MSDAELLAACRAGDPRAFAELVGRYRTNAWHVCLKITGNTADAEDALQDALTAAWQNLDKFRGDARFGTWLHRIAANAALVVVRRRRVVTSIDDADGSDEIDLRSTAQSVEDRVTTADSLYRALDQLSDDLRVALVLADVVDLPYADIAEHQQISLATVKTRIHRARKQVAAAMADA